MKNLTKALALSLALFAASSFAQTVKVATGGAKLTYSAMFKQMTEVCGNTVPLVEVNSTGSMANIDMLVGNEVNAGFVQSDVLWLRARTEELGNVKTLLALHSEQIHLIARNEIVKTGGVMGIGAKESVLQDITHLSGRRVGASGGSAVTAKVVRLQSEVAFQVVEYPTNDALMLALGKGEVDAALIVGGQPVALVKGLSAAFKLLSIPASVQERLKGVYKTARLTYSNLNAAGVTTMSTEALMVSREYKTPKMLASLGAFRSCVLGKVDEIKDTTGSHPAWQGVDVNNKGKWAWMDLPGAAK